MATILESIHIPQTATDKIDHKFLNRWVKDRICEEGMDYLRELAEELLPAGIGRAQIRILIENHPGDIKSCFTKLIDKWDQRDVDATWQKLIDALRYTNKHTLASNVENSLLVTFNEEPLLQKEVDEEMILSILENQSNVEDFSVECQLDRSVLIDLNAKYVALLAKLKKVYKKRKKEYPVRDIIIGLCAADKRNLTYFPRKKLLIQQRP